MSIAEWSGTSLPWTAEVAGLNERLGGLFQRSETRAQAGLYLDGLIGGVERRNGWQLAEHVGDEAPWRMQAVLGRSFWDAERARDICRDYVVERLGDASGVLVLDETGFVKKGTHSVGVARQYSGTAGRIENCQVGVFLAYASHLGQTLIDRRLYLPEAWAGDSARRNEAHVPEKVTFATKLQIAGELISAALDAGAPCAWVLADALYGSDSRLRRLLGDRRQPYVLAVRSNLHLRFVTRKGFVQTDPRTLADELAANAWKTHAAGEGTKGITLYDWARIGLPWVVDDGFERWILIRRNRNN